MLIGNNDNDNHNNNDECVIFSVILIKLDSNTCIYEK